MGKNEAEIIEFKPMEEETPKKEERHLYNESQKELYLSKRENQNLNIRTIMKTLFLIAEPYEREFGKDCSCFTPTQIKDMYTGTFTHSIDWLYNFNNQLKIYTSWCLANNLVPNNQNFYDTFGKEELQACLNNRILEERILTRNELIKLLNDIPNVSDQFLALAIFEGVSGYKYADFYEMTLDNINFQENLLTTYPKDEEDDENNKQRVLKVSDLLLKLAEESAITYQKYSNSEIVLREYKPGDPDIIKENQNAQPGKSLPKNYKKIYTRIYHLEQEFGPALSYAGLHESGRIHMLNVLMAQDNSQDAFETYKKHRDEIEYRYGVIPRNRFKRWFVENEPYFNN